MSWVITVSAADGTVLSSEYYTQSDNGSVGALLPMAGSTFYPVVYLLGADGSEGLTCFETPFDATAPLDLQFVAAETGMTAVFVLSATDVAGNSGSVGAAVDL